MRGKRGNPGLKGKLVAKSLDAYVLSLETINRLSVKYRVEAFCYLMQCLGTTPKSQDHRCRQRPWCDLLPQPNRLAAANNITA